MRKDGNRDNNNITINKRTLILSLVIVVSLSVFLVVSGQLSSYLLPLSTVKQVRAQQQPSSQPQQPSSRSQSPSSSSSPSPSSSSLSSAPTSSSPSRSTVASGNSGNNPHGGTPGLLGTTPGQSGRPPPTPTPPPTPEPSQCIPGLGSSCPAGQHCWFGTCLTPSAIACNSVVRALLNQVPGAGIPGQPYPVNCPNGLVASLTFPSAVTQLGQFCTVQDEQLIKAFDKHVQECKAGTCPECQCPSGQIVKDGSCQCSVPGQVVKDGSCQCSVPGAEVINGACQCPAGTGFLFNACIPCGPNEVTQNGICVACTSGTACNNECLDLNSPESCGTSCDNIIQCNAPPGGTATCNSGQCKQTCPVGQALQNGVCEPCPSGTLACDNKCIELSDPTTCGTSCNDLKTCAAPTGGSATCDGGQCKQTCPAGQVVVNGVCEPCPSGTTVCDNKCTDLKSQTTCGTTCGNIRNCESSTEIAGSVCQDGTCVCKFPSKACGSDDPLHPVKCTDTFTDKKNCGDCGIDCATKEVAPGVPYPDPSCNSGVCSPCPPGKGLAACPERGGNVYACISPGCSFFHPTPDASCQVICG